MQNNEKEVSDLYGRLWLEIENVHTPEIISQFLYNVDLNRDWFKNKKCLDVGCGSGFAVWVLQRLGATCHACDLGFNSLQNVRKNLGGSGLLVNASVLEMPYASEIFDFVHCSGVLHHTTDPKASFAELIRVTRKGGTLFLGLYGKGGFYNMVLRLGRAVAHFIPYSWTKEAISVILRGRRVSNSFMLAKVSILDNLYIPIRERFREKEIRQWFAGTGFEDVVRTQTTIYDHQKQINRLIHGEGYLQLRGKKSRKESCVDAASLSS